MTLFIVILAIIGCFFTAVVIVQKVNGCGMEKAIEIVCDWLKANFSSQSNTSQRILVNVPYFCEEIKKIVDKYSELGLDVSNWDEEPCESYACCWIEFIGNEERLNIFKIHMARIVEKTLKVSGYEKGCVIMSVQNMDTNHYKVMAYYAVTEKGIYDLRGLKQRNDNLKRESAKNGLGAPVDADLERELNNEC